VATDRARATYTTPKLSAQTGEPADLKSDDCTGLGLAAQLSMSFVPVGGKTLGIQITTSGTARLLRTLFGAILGIMRLEVLSLKPAFLCDARQR